ncbi:hypothetical protein D7V93_07120 [Corallococcus llansteffanensis]|uniref:Uncharacterized protein n=1 Tax=Corallococcus llansteffanensis TaxID=2316731 RepID=A0A3A8QEG2_9BACT|nr:hypothetical protein D7V93_07120 [Corallococcus llansteffanensis]
MLLTYDDWNRCLFRATFSVDANEPNAREPVTHIDTSDEFIFNAAERYAPGVRQAGLLDRFNQLVGGALRSDSIDTCLKWPEKEIGLPSVYYHLVTFRMREGGRTVP